MKRDRVIFTGAYYKENGEYVPVTVTTPRRPICGALSGIQPKLLVRLVDGKYVGDDLSDDGDTISTDQDSSGTLSVETLTTFLRSALEREPVSKPRMKSIVDAALERHAGHVRQVNQHR